MGALLIRIHTEGKQPIDFHIPEDEDTLSSLKKDFKAYPQYGLGHDWSSYSPQDAASLLLYFLKRLGQPLIPYEFLEAFRNPCRSSSTVSEARKLGVYCRLVASLYPVQRHLLLYLLDFLSFFSSSTADIDLLSLRFLNVFFRGPSDLTSLFEVNDLRTSLATIKFLVRHHHELGLQEDGNLLTQTWIEGVGPHSQWFRRPVLLMPTQSETNEVLVAL